MTAYARERGMLNEKGTYFEATELFKLVDQDVDNLESI